MINITIIGCTLSMEEGKLILSPAYTQFLLSRGVLPWLYPYIDDLVILEKISEYCDGLLLTGGGDPDPAFLGEDPFFNIKNVYPQRDRMEIELVKLFHKQKKPILGICRGCQILNIALGGDIYQDINEQCKNVLQHNQSADKHLPWHNISISSSTLLASCYPPPRQRVNSFHHQAIKKVSSLLKPVAFASDGVIEAVESIDNNFVLGVQWHPECLYKSDYSKKLFSCFIDACEEYYRLR